MIAVGFVLGAACGAVARHVTVDRLGRPGTLAVNVVGSLVLGVLVGLRLDGALSVGALTVLGTGFCGALTTWSGFALDATTLLTADDRRAARAYVAVSLVLGLAAAGVGLGLTGAL